MKAKHSGLAGLLTIIILVAVLYYSGAGGWVVERVKGLSGSCYALMDKAGFSSGGSVCDGIARGVDFVVEAGTSLVEQVKGSVRGSGAQLQDAAAETFGRMKDSSALAALTSPGERLQAMMEQSPRMADLRANAAEKLQTSLDQFVIGQHYLKNATPEKAVAWFQQSARQPDGYGVLSQLTLGDMYRTGNGVEQNNEGARYYYASAQRSLAQLELSDTPQARTLLENLPTDSATLRQQLNQHMGALR